MFTADTCKQGFVWREATKDDHVCVTPATRTQAANTIARPRVDALEAEQMNRIHANRVCLARSSTVRSRVRHTGGQSRCRCR